MIHGMYRRVLCAVLFVFAAAALAAQSVRPDNYEPDSMSAPVEITRPGDWILRTFHDERDVDWFKITANNVILVAETSGDIDTTLTIYNAATGEELVEDDDSGNGSNARIEYEAGKGEILLIKVSRYGTESGSYSFRAAFEVAQAPWEEPNNSREQATAITLGQRVEAGLQSGGDIDWYRVTVPGGGGQLIAFTESRLDTVMSLHDAQGRQLVEDDDGGEGGNARCAAIVLQGTVYIQVRGYDDSTRGNYSITTELREAPKPDSYENDNTAPRAKDITVGAPQEHTFTDASDIDWARFTVRSAGRYTIRAVGVSPSLDPHLELYTGEQDPIAEDDDGGDAEYDARISQYLEPGVYLIKAYNHNSDPVDNNRYTLSVTQE